MPNKASLCTNTNTNRHTVNSAKQETQTPTTVQHLSPLRYAQRTSLPIPRSLSTAQEMTALKTACHTALTQARSAHHSGTFAVGAVLRHNGKTLFSVPNQVIQLEKHGPQRVQHTLHAEMGLLNWYDKQAQKDIPLPPLNETDVLTSLAPCLMCLGRLLKNNVKHIRYLAEDDFAGITESNAHQYLPDDLATNATQHISGVQNWPDLITESGKLFTDTCENVKAKTNSTDQNPLSPLDTAVSLTNPLFNTEGTLTDFAKRAILQRFTQWAATKNPVNRVSILGPNLTFTITKENQDEHDNAFLQAVTAWDATPPQQRPSLKDCVFITNDSLNLDTGKIQARWDRVHSIGILGSTAEGQPLTVVTQTPMSETAQARLRSLPPIYQNLRVIDSNTLLTPES